MRSPVPILIRTFLFTATVLCLAIVAHADDYDYTFGADARIFAMGGAGLAATRNQGTYERRYNPAALASTPKGYAIYAPSFSFRADGAISITKAYSYLFSGAKLSDTTDLIRRYGTEDSVFGLNTSLGFRVGSFELLVQGVGKSRLLPNATLTNWAKAGADLTRLPSGAQADVLAAGYITLPSIAYAIKIPMHGKLVHKDDAQAADAQAKNAAKDDDKKGYDAAVGVRARVLQTYYTRYFLNQNIVLGNADPVRGAELNGKDYLKNTGVAADLGFLFTPRAGKGVSAAVVFDNIVKPSTKYQANNIGLLQYQGRVSDGEDFNLLQTTVSLGAALETGGLTVAADLMDLSGATRPIDLRLGVEQKIGKPLALRAGFSSNTGITGGFGLFGFDFAFGQRLPLEVNKTIRF